MQDLDIAVLLNCVVNTQQYRLVHQSHASCNFHIGQPETKLEKMNTISVDCFNDVYATLISLFCSKLGFSQILETLQGAFGRCSRVRL